MLGSTIFYNPFLSAMKKWILRASVLALAATACKKNNDPESSLPPATQDGSNTAGWLADGVPHVARASDASLLSSALPAISGGFTADSVLSIYIAGYKDPTRPRVILVFKAHAPGTYYLDGRAIVRSGSRNRGLYDRVGSPITRHYTTTTRYTGRVVLTRVDFQHDAAAGLFEFRAVDYQDTTQTLTVTNGRFDYAGQ